jgi:hypothetical protein
MVTTQKEIQTSEKMGLSLPTKEQGSLGLQNLNLEIQNKCVSSKWLFKLFNERGVW